MWTIPRANSREDKSVNRAITVLQKKLQLNKNSDSGYIVVSRVKTYSVAGEDSKVEVGDILDEIDGAHLFGVTPETISRIVKKKAGRIPIRLSVIKAKSFGSNCIFPSMTSLLVEAGIDVSKLEEVTLQTARSQTRIRFKEGSPEECSLLEENFEDEEEEEETDVDQVIQENKEENKKQDLVTGNNGTKNMFMAKHGYHLSYMGSLQIGRIGEDNSFLDHAISKVVNAGNKVEHEVSLHILEFGVRLYCRKSGKQVLYYPYPKISACGVSSLNQNYLCFIGAEDDVCALAKKFLCHVFYTENKQMSKQIVASMASGFDRTLSAA